MSLGRSLFAATLAGTVLLTVSPASSQTLRYANQGDLKSLDPYTLNESTTHAHLGHKHCLPFGDSYILGALAPAAPHQKAREDEEEAQMHQHLGHPALSLASLEKPMDAAKKQA